MKNNVFQTADDKQALDSDWRLLRGLIRESARRYPAQLGIGLAALLVSSGSLLSIPKVLGVFIDLNAAGAQMESLHFAAGAMMAVVAVYAASVALRVYLLTWVGERLVANIRERVYSHLLKLPLGFFENHPTGDLLSRLTSDVGLLQTLIGIVIPIGLRSAVQLVGSLLLMASLSWQLTAVVLLVGPVLARVAVLFGGKVRQAADLSRQAESQVVVQMEATLNAVDTVKSFSAEKQEAERFGTLCEANFRALEKLMRARGWFTFIIFFLALNVAVAVLYAGGRQVLAQAMNWSMVTQYILYLSFAAFGVAGLSEIFGEVKKTAGATRRLFEILQQEPEDAGTAPSCPAPRGGGAVVFDRVEFAYPARPLQPVLREFNLAIRSGERVALVGPSGAGKTTVLRLLLRFYDPKAGSITLDDLDLREWDPRVLRGQVAVVSQEPAVFSGTAWDNIRYGRPEAKEQEMLEASRLAQADEFIRGLPRGYDTQLGEKGRQLSTGQRQRLAIARALVRQPRILVLDEATSALDAENESALRKVFTQTFKGRTVLIVAHRLATVQAADRVVFIHHGRIVGEGPHAALVETCPLYADLIAKEFEPADYAISGANTPCPVTPNGGAGS